MNILTDWLMGHDKSVVSTKHRSIHTYVIGQSGTGKSRALESWIMQDILAGQGVGVIDPHGELYQNLLYRLASRPETWDRIILIDPLDPKWVVGFNPLLSSGSYHPERLALYLTDVAIKVWHIKTSNAPRLVWLLTNSFLALADLGLSLLDLPRFLADNSYRDNLLPKLKHKTTRNYFKYEFPTSEGAVNQWISPVLNKIGGLIFDQDIRLMFFGENTINFRELMDNQKILLVHLPKGIIGEAPSSLLAAFIVAHIQKSALARVDRGSQIPFYLYLDEFQNYTTDNIKDILSESRKYALSLTLAHQYLDQLPGELRSAVLNTAGTLVSFRIGYHDATQIVKEIFPGPDYIKNFKTNISLRNTNRVPLPFMTSKDEPLGWDGLTLELANLMLREFWVRKRGPYNPVKQFSFYMPDPKITQGLNSRVQELRDESGKRYGKLKTQIRKNLNQNTNIYHEPSEIPGWSE
jgi:hypothetical protein